MSFFKNYLRKIFSFKVDTPEPEKIHSKEAIMDSVWQDKVVSEQAVFQNISHLRILFGNHAIKTFSKRGYQWQLNAEINTDPLSSPENDINSQSIAKTSTLSQVKPSNYWPLISLFCLLLPVSSIAS